MLCRHIFLFYACLHKTISCNRKFNVIYIQLSPIYSIADWKLDLGHKSMKLMSSTFQTQQSVWFPFGCLTLTIHCNIYECDIEKKFQRTQNKLRQNPKNIKTQMRFRGCLDCNQNIKKKKGLNHINKTSNLHNPCCYVKDLYSNEPLTFKTKKWKNKTHWGRERAVVGEERLIEAMNWVFIFFLCIWKTSFVSS